MKNIRRRLQDAGEFSVSSRQSTIYVEPKDSAADLDLAEERVSKVFGVVGYAGRVCAKKISLPSASGRGSTCPKSWKPLLPLRWSVSAATSSFPTNRQSLRLRWATTCWSSFPTCG